MANRSSEENRVGQMIDEMAQGRDQGRKFRWNPHTKEFETASSTAHEDPEKLNVTLQDLGHSAS